MSPTELTNKHTRFRRVNEKRIIIITVTMRRGSQLYFYPRKISST